MRLAQSGAHQFAAGVGEAMERSSAQMNRINPAISRLCSRVAIKLNLPSSVPLTRA